MFGLAPPIIATASSDPQIASMTSIQSVIRKGSIQNMLQKIALMSPLYRLLSKNLLMEPSYAENAPLVYLCFRCQKIKQDPAGLDILKEDKIIVQ